MIAPLRPALLNWQISLRAREIAHDATRTCHSDVQPLGDDYHTSCCNRLKRQIEELVFQVKLARLQPPGQLKPRPAEEAPAPPLPDQLPHI